MHVDAKMSRLRLAARDAPRERIRPAVRLMKRRQVRPRLRRRERDPALSLTVDRLRLVPHRARRIVGIRTRPPEEPDLVLHAPESTRRPGPTMQLSPAAAAHHARSYVPARPSARRSSHTPPRPPYSGWATRGSLLPTVIDFRATTASAPTASTWYRQTPAASDVSRT